MDATQVVGVVGEIVFGELLRGWREQHSESESGPHQTLNGRLERLERQVEKLSETVSTKKDLDRLYQQIRDMIYP